MEDEQGLQFARRCGAGQFFKSGLVDIETQERCSGGVGVEIITTEEAIRLCGARNEGSRDGLCVSLTKCTAQFGSEEDLLIGHARRKKDTDLRGLDVLQALPDLRERL